MNRICLLLILLVTFQKTVFAACDTDRFGVVVCGQGDCAKDRQGNVFCSKYFFGDALKDKNGNIVCGKSQCISGTKFDDFYCSTQEGGGAKLDRLGDVKCYGGCEKASSLMCENVKGN
jgi:hypothetical protein